VKYTFPTETYGNDVVLMEIDISILPIVAGNIKLLACEHIWIDENSWRNGYNAVAEMLLMKNGIVEAIDRLYRLTDNIHNGVVYTSNGATPPVVTPAIPSAPGAVDGLTVGLRRQLLDAQGVLPSGWFGWGDAPATTADLVRALRNDSQDQIDRVKSSFSALQTLAQGATVFDVVSGFLEEGASLTAEGGILATLIVSMMASTVGQSAQVRGLQTVVDKLDRLIASLDGGATPAPATNVIAELQTTNTLLG
jgi:hypothetical protein